MSHFKQGYAVVEFTYTFNADRVDYSHTKTGGYSQQDNSKASEASGQFSKPLEPSDYFLAVREGKYYAECKKNETNDHDLSKWVKDIVMPQAIEEITATINSRNEANRERREQWEVRQQQLVRDGKQFKVTGIKPRKVTYPPFDRKGLKMGKPKCVPDKPQEGDGKEIGWTN